jgi:general nucleoside transport system permease protein
MSDTTVVAPARPPAPAAQPPAVPTHRRGEIWRDHAWRALLYVVSIGVALAISAVLVALTHGSPSKVFTALYDGSVKGWGSFGYTLDNATPLLIVAIGTIVAVRAGFFNIGQEGQLTIGAMCAAFVALRVHPDGTPVLVLALIAAALGGALWAGICALLRFWRGVDVVISSLLLIFVAQQLLSFTLSTPTLLQEHGTGVATLTESDQLSPGVQLHHFGEYPHFNFGSGLLIALGLTVVVGIFMARTKWGFRIRMLGLNPVAAKRAGVRAAVLGSIAIMISGATAGLAGGVMLTGQAYRITPTISNNVGWNGLLVALVARNHAYAAIAVALLFGGLEAGGGFLAVTGVPTDLVNIVIALVVAAVVFPPALTEFRKYRRARALASAAATGATEAVAA